MSILTAVRPTTTAAAAAAGGVVEVEPVRTPVGGARPGSRLVGVLARVGRLAVTLVLVVSGVAFLFLAVGPHVLGYRTATMLTGSMAPMIVPGDVVVTAPKPASQVAVGDVITYRIPIEDQRVETHRVVEVLAQPDGRVAVRTQGDANANVDPWVAVLDGDTVWEVQGVVPVLGTVIRALRAPVVQDGVLWVALAGVLGLGLSSIWGGEPRPSGGARRAARRADR